MTDWSGIPRSFAALRAGHDAKTAGREIHARIRDLYPICRSITGEGVRETLRRLGAEIPIQIREVPTGTPVLDWVVPKEWNIRDAFIKNSRGDRVVDFHASNLHVVNYSVPVRARLSLAELRPHLFSIADHPDWIPYKTSYYRETWGFCLSHRQLESLPDGEYEVCIDSSLEQGSLTFGEFRVAGREAREVLFSCHICHPSLCNDNLSGVSVAVAMAKLLSGAEGLRYSYRFLFAPGTIGAITWLALNEDRAANVAHGLVLACLGDRGHLTFKRSRRGDAEIDRAVVHALKHSQAPHVVEEFSPYGYDERQFCSPGFNMPVGVLSRTPYARFAEYHTSADNPDFVDPDSLADSLDKCLDVVEILEGNEVPVSRNQKAEPQLGRRGLYSTMGGHTTGDVRQEEALLWVLNMSDGAHSLLEIADRAGLPFASVRAAAGRLAARGLLGPSVTE